MKSILVLTILLSLVGCGPGFRAGKFQSSTANSADSAGDYIDAYYIDEDDTEEQLELDLGDKVEEKPEEQIELPLEPETPEQKPEDKQEDKQEQLPVDKPVVENKDSKEEPKEESKNDPKRDDIAKRPSDIGRAQLLKPTVYYLPSNDTAPFRACKANDTKFFKAKKGQTLLSGKSEIKVCSKFYYAVQMQGSGLVRTRDDRQYLINYVGAEDGIPRYKIIDRDTCAYGLGMANLCLQPFISIAADRNRYKAGDVIFVPAVAAANIKLPDGDTHQGFFIVTDTGEAIVGAGRFDFYTGPMHYSDPKNPFVKLGLQSKVNKGRLTYQLVRRNSQTQSQVLEYYKGRQIIPYTK